MNPKEISMNDRTSFHAGERAAQQRAGETDIADYNIAMVGDTVVSRARPFIAGQLMAVLGSIDESGKLWASMLFGKPGFVHTDDGTSIVIDVPGNERDPADPVWANMVHNKDLGMLFIELGSRHRYRINGAISRLDEDGVEVLVREAFPNCPKYIQRRRLHLLGKPGLPGQTARGTVMRGVVADIVRRADTLFVASRHAETGADVSHRGGGVGFIHIVNDTTLRIPDFVGNSMFNTLGNLTIDPRAGVCIPDFAQGQLLQLTGTATVRWDQDDPEDETGGTGRYWEFKIDNWILRDSFQQLKWEYLDASSFNPPVQNGLNETKKRLMDLAGNLD
jgi:predicted pyridoxine 5'-phosphate oxidase superfamily flavin-nucleotide-binding protein